MMSYAIVSRDFWPNAAAIGDGLMCLARTLSQTDQVSVVTMSRQNLTALDSTGNGEIASKVVFSQAKPLTDSSSSLILRAFELVYFSFWVMFSLARLRPSIVYVSTNPPLLVPLVVSVYCKLFGKKYVYHIQDIHPESTSLLINLPDVVIAIFRLIDTWVLNGASKVVTLTKEMKGTLLKRGVETKKIVLMENPSLVYKTKIKNKINGVVFSGNAGRLQLMDIVLAGIERYIKQGGKLPFCFVGSGIYKHRLKELSDKYETFSYKGYVDAATAMKITSEYRWAMLPIMPEALSYAYPSKIPTYISAGCKIVSITNGETSLAKWIEVSGLGQNVEPSVDELSDYFHGLESDNSHEIDISPKLPFTTPRLFAKGLHSILIGVR